MSLHYKLNLSFSAWPAKVIAKLALWLGVALYGVPQANKARRRRAVQCGVKAEVIHRPAPNANRSTATGKKEL